MEDEVADLVLRDNYEQAQAIYTSAAQAASMLEVHERYLDSLEQSGTLNRELESMPDDEVLAERKAAGGGLTTPEFAILLSYTKNALADELLASDLPDDPQFGDTLARYFPTQLRERFGDQLQRHPLRREIVVARVVNELLNRCGTTMAFRLQDETGAGADDVVRAFTAATELFGLRTLWAEIEALDGKVPAQTQVAMLLKLRIPLERSARWLLRNRRRPLDIAETVARFAAGTSALADALAVLDPSGRAEANALVAAGVPQQLAERVAFSETLVPSLDIAEIAASSGLDVTSVAEVYFGLGTSLDLNWLRDRVVALPRDDRWEAMARAALRDDVYAEQAALTAEVIRSGSDGVSARERIETWSAQNADAVERCLQVLGDIKAGGAGDLARLSVAVREIRNLTQSSEAAAPSVERAELRSSGA
jgi:glutamate dehydrogenase